MIAAVSAPVPEIAVVVGSHDRPLRLRWLLDALAEQTLPRERWELVVAHDSHGPGTEELLAEHPLARAGVLRHVRLEAGTAPPGRNRNAAWRMTAAPIVAFTDDDCRPPREWLERALAAARRHPEAIVQGSTMPDPEEGEIGRTAPYSHSQSIWPPSPRAQACNIIYPRALLERCGGFPEDMLVGEDTALAESARELGAPLVGAPEVMTRHAVVESSLLGMLRGTRRWEGLPLLVRRHPGVRRDFPMGLFWKRTHAWAPFAALGIALLRRTRLAALLAVPYLIHATPSRHGQHPRGRLRALSELPGRFALDVAEMLVLARGSIRHRTPFL